MNKGIELFGKMERRREIERGGKIGRIDLFALNLKKTFKQAKIFLLHILAVLGLLFAAVNTGYAQVVPPPWWPGNTVPQGNPLWLGNGSGYNPGDYHDNGGLVGLYHFNDAILATGAHRLHAIGITGQGLTTAIVNGGFDISHEIFNGKVLNADYKNVSGTSMSYVDHGNHVAGTVLSMAPGSMLWLGQFNDPDLPGLFDSILTANDAGAHIVSVNNSWGYNGYYYDTPEEVRDAFNQFSGFPELTQAIQNLTDSGVIVVGASGNEAVNNQMGYPDGLPGVLAVGALNPYGHVAAFSNQYDKGNLFLVAPGVNVWSADAAGYRNMSGTSMASPHVAGAVTLLKSGAREASSQEIIDSLYASADVVHYRGGTVLTAAEISMTGWANVAWFLNDELQWMRGLYPAYFAKYADWLEDRISDDELNDLSADEWRIYSRLWDAYFFLVDYYERYEELNLYAFIYWMGIVGEFSELGDVDFGFLRVDKAYMDLSGKRMELIAGAIDPGLSGILYGYAGELRTDLNQDTADIFQRMDAQDPTTQTVMARQMSPRFTNATAESAHLGFVGLHRSLGRRAEINRLGQGLNRSSTCCGVGLAVETSGWIEGFGGGFEKSGTLSNAAYDGHFAGTAFGIERKRHHQTFGLFGHWANHRVSGDGLAKGNWVNFGVYGRADQCNNFLEGSISYGFGDYNLTRNINIPGHVYGGVDGPLVLDPIHRSAGASTRAHDFSTRLATGRNFWNINGWKVGPRSEISLSYLIFNGYEESGAQSLDLSVDGYRTTYLEGGVGLFAGKQFRVGAKRFVATGKLMGMYGGMMGHDLSGCFRSYGNRYRVDPDHLSSAWLVPEATLAWNIASGLVVSGNYSGRFGERYGENTASVALNLYW